MLPCFAGKYSCAEGGRGFYDSPRAFKDAPRERRGILNILRYISGCARCILVDLVLVEIKAIKNARGSKATAGHRKHPCSRNTFKASVTGYEKWNMRKRAADVASSAEIKLISRRVPGVLFTHPRSPTVALICPMQRVITAPMHVQGESSRNFQRYQGRWDLRFGYRPSFPLSPMRPRIFSRLSRW